MFFQPRNTKPTLVLGFLCLFCLLGLAHARLQVEQRVTLAVQDAPLRQVLQEITRQTSIDIVFGDDLISNTTVSCSFENIPLHDALEKILYDTGISFRVLNENQIVLVSLESPFRVAIKGRVIDAQTGAPLENVNVFLSNTMMGGATNRNGEFIIAKVPVGKFDLVVSRIGYAVQTRRISISGPLNEALLFKLSLQPYQFPEIEVSATERKQWQKNLKKFTQLFLGTSQNASECALLNPEVLDFEKDKKSKLFQATASAPLQIVNRSLGYLIYFILEDFSFEDEELNYLGLVRFEELSPSGKKEERKWRRNRVATYNGSLRHFLFSLFNGRLKEEGFLLYEVSDLPRDRWIPYRTQVTGPRHLYYTRSPIDKQFPFERELRFKDYLEVVYTTETEEKGYLDYKFTQKGTFVSKNRLLTWQPQNQRSWMEINHDRPVSAEVIIDNFGHLDDPHALKSYGYWAWERVAEMLPWEYQPGVSRHSEPDGPLKPQRDLKAEAVAVFALQDSLEELRVSKTSLMRLGQRDPKIAIAFLELVTDKKAREFYEEACELYYWGFSRQPLDASKKDVLAEIERMSPLLDEDEVVQWRADLNSDNPDIFAKIKQFWLEKDPTPTTALNERLIEHWERIAYARQHFNENDNSPYGTDDRGLIYVKYGAPSRTRSVTLGTNPIEIYSVAIEMGIRRGRGEFRSDIQSYINFPQCEVWAYSVLEGKGYLVYLFGHKEGKFSYGLRTGVEEFIQNSAFRRVTHGVVVGPVIQMVYYSALTAFDMSFSDRMNELDRHLGEVHIPGKNNFNAFLKSRAAKSLNARFEIHDRADLRRKLEEPQRSLSASMVSSVPLIAIRSRFLDRQNRPVLYFEVFAFPIGVIEPNLEELLTRRIKPGNHARFTLLVRDDNLDEIQRLTAMPAKTFDNTAIAKIPHKKNQAHYTLAVETFDDSTPIDSLDAHTPLGVGKVFLEGLEPLDPDSQKIEVSDLVIGVEAPAEIATTELPFELVPSSRIWKADVMQAYLEVYHLQLSSDNIGSFNLDCRIFRLKGKKKKRQEMISTSFDFDSFGTTAKENFGISIANLAPGNYELEVEITDRNSDQKKRRKASFEVMKE